jgi:beta-galactosidase
MYMVHGGTNFALTAGANSYNDVMDYKADVTSYDYDSPINEQGAATPKYHALK